MGGGELSRLNGSKLQVKGMNDTLRIGTSVLSSGGTCV